MAKADTDTPEGRAQHRAQYLTGLLWHLGAFVIINGFFWILDAGDIAGVTWAPFITIAWGLGLAFHVLAWYIDGRNLEARLAARYLEEEQRRAAAD